MTKRVIHWEVLETAINENEKYMNDLGKYNSLKKQKEELSAKLSELENTKEPPIPKAFEDLGILSVICLATIRDFDFESYFEIERDEAKIVGVTNDTITVRFSESYYSTKTVEIPMKDIKENGYFIVDDNWFICDKLDLDKRRVLLDLIFRHSKEELEKQIKWKNEQIERYNHEIDEDNKKLAKYNNIPESWVRKVLNKLDFSISLGRTFEETKQEVEKTVGSLPRVYKI